MTEMNSKAEKAISVWIKIHERMAEEERRLEKLPVRMEVRREERAA